MKANRKQAEWKLSGTVLTKLYRSTEDTTATLHNATSVFDRETLVTNWSAKWRWEQIVCKACLNISSPESTFMKDFSDFLGRSEDWKVLGTVRQEIENFDVWILSNVPFNSDQNELCLSLQCSGLPQFSTSHGCFTCYECYEQIHRNVLARLKYSWDIYLSFAKSPIDLQWQ